MQLVDRVKAIEAILAQVTDHDFVIMAGQNQIYGVNESTGNHGFLHLNDRWLVGNIVVLPLRLARRTCEWLGGEPVMYRNFLQFELNKLKARL